MHTFLQTRLFSLTPDGRKHEHQALSAQPGEKNFPRKEQYSDKKTIGAASLLPPEYQIEHDCRGFIVVRRLWITAQESGG